MDRKTVILILTVLLACAAGLFLASDGSDAADNAVGEQIIHNQMTFEITEPYSEVSPGELVKGELELVKCGSQKTDVTAEDWNADGRYEVTSIRSGAFTGPNLKTVIVPGTVEDIGRSVFSGCSGLTHVKFSDGVLSIGADAISRCPSLTTVSIPASTSSIAGGFFSECWKFGLINLSEDNHSFELVGGNLYDEDVKKLIACPSDNPATWFNIPTTVTAVGDRAFAGNQNLKEIVINENITELGSACISRCASLETVIFLGGTEDIRMNTVVSCQRLTSVEFHDGVQSVRTGAISDCARLKSVSFPASVSGIAGNFCVKCGALDTVTVGADSQYYTVEGGVVYSKDLRSLVCYPVALAGTSFTIPSGVTSILDNAFYMNRYLRDVTIPSGVTSLGTSCFSKCVNLQSVTVPGSVQTIPYSAFAGCDALGSVTVGEGVTSIGDSAFLHTSVTELALPDSLTSVGNSAFSLCTSLTSVGLPDSLESLGRNAFRGCTSLKTVTVPSGIEVGSGAFAGCTSMSEVTIGRDVTLAADSFGPGFTSGGAACADPSGYSFVLEGGVYKAVGVHVRVFVTDADVRDGYFPYGKGAEVLPEVVIEGHDTVLCSDAGRTEPLPDGYRLTGPADVFVKAVPHMHTLSVNDGSTTVPLQIAYGTLLPDVLRDPSRQNYVFTGWFTDRECQNALPDDGTMPDSDLSLYAGWDPVSFTVTFVTGASPEMPPVSQRYTEEYIIPDCPHRGGFGFRGWDVFPDTVKVFDGRFVMPACDVTLTAVWEQLVSADDLRPLPGTDRAVVDVTADYVRFGADAIGSLSGEGSADRIEMGFHGATMVLPSGALEVLSRDAGSVLGPVTMEVDVMSTVPPEMIEKVSESDRELLEEAGMLLKVGIDSHGARTGLGDVSVTLDYELREGDDPDRIIVVFVGDDGTVERLETSYTDGKVTFVTSHFSTFAVTFEEPAPSGGSGGNALPIAIGVVAVILVAVLAVLYIRSRQQ